MMKKRVFVLLAFFVNLSLAFSWGSRGHKITAQVALSCLDQQVTDSVKYYLEETTFEEASVWMDEVRGDHTYDYMKPMHYVNIENDKTYVKVSEPNIINALDLVIAELKNRKGRSKEEVKKSLLMVFHLVGDLHQPLHAGYADDKGGNTVEVDFFGRKSNLHKVWDTNIIEDQQISAEKCSLIISKLSAAEKKKLRKIDVMEWTAESRNYLALAYSFKDAAIDKDYVSKAVPVIERRLSEAGIRLASVLTAAFGKAE